MSSRQGRAARGRLRSSTPDNLLLRSFTPDNLLLRRLTPNNLLYSMSLFIEHKQRGAEQKMWPMARRSKRCFIILLIRSSRDAHNHIEMNDKPSEESRPKDVMG